MIDSKQAGESEDMHARTREQTTDRVRWTRRPGTDGAGAKGAFSHLGDADVQQSLLVDGGPDHGVAHALGHVHRLACIAAAGNENETASRLTMASTEHLAGAIPRRVRRLPRGKHTALAVHIVH